MSHGFFFAKAGMNSRESEAALRRSFTLLLTCALLLWGAYTIAAPGELGDNQAQNNNPHNLSSLSTTPGGETDVKATNTTEICVFCHIPHGGTPQTILWGRAAPGGMGSFPLYSATPRDGSGVLGIADPTISGSSKYTAAEASAGNYPNGASKLCLSCHDGLTALGVWNGDVEFVVSPGFMPTSGIIDLTTSHPISFYYTSAIKDAINALPSKTATYTMPTTVPLEVDSASGNTRVQCTICHEPHKDTKEGGYTLPFWRNASGTPGQEANDYDAICNDCHTVGYYPYGSPGGRHNLP